MINDRVRKGPFDKEPTQSSTSSLVIVYHNDLDGVASAFVLAQSLGIENPEHNQDVKFISYAHHTALLHQEEIIDSIGQDTKLYFVDVAPSKRFMDELTNQDRHGHKKLSSIEIIDHHESAANELEGYVSPYSYNDMPKVSITFDKNSLSAVNLVWDETMPKEFEKPDSIKLLHMMDRLALKTRKDFAASAYVETLKIVNVEDGFEALRDIAKLSFNEMSGRGDSTLRFQEPRIDKMLEKVEVARIEILPGKVESVPMINADICKYGRFFSHKLVELGRKYGSGIACAWHEMENGTVNMSLRSDGVPNLSKVSAHFKMTMGVTGGGHENSAAVQFASVDEFRASIYRPERPAPRHPQYRAVVNL